MSDVASYPFLHTVFLGVFAVIAALCLAGLLYGVFSKRFTDKLVAVNLVTTLSLNAILMLAVLLKEDFLIDVALIYALLSFAAIVVLAKLLREQKKKEAEK